jgi:hypothetical protein
MDSPASPTSTDSWLFPNHRLRTGAWPPSTREFFSHSGVWRLRPLPSPSFAKAISGSRRNRLVLLLRGCLSAARGSHVPSVTAPTPPSTFYLLFILLSLYFFLVYFWAFLYLSLPHVHLCLCVWVLKDLYIHQTTLTGGSDS